MHWRQTYRTAHDGKVRPEHAVLHNVTLPPSDPFWDEFYPPNGWNCRCNVVQVRKSKYPTTDPDEAMALGSAALGKDTKGIFRFNPGKERKSIPDYNPYTIRQCRDCSIAKGKIDLAKPFIPNSDQCTACKYVRSCFENKGTEIVCEKGKIIVNGMVNTQDSDYTKLYQIAEYFAKEGEIVELMPKMTRPPKFRYECVYGDLIGTKYECKCPDLKIGEYWYEHEGFTSHDPKRAFNNMMNHGLKQSNRIIIDRPGLTDRFMHRSVVNRIHLGADIEEVWIRETDGSLTLLYKKTDG